MNKLTRKLTCKKCKINFELPMRCGKTPMYCSDKCRGINVGQTRTWNLTCKACKKDWVHQAKGGRKPHFCRDCYEKASYERHMKRLKERNRRYAVAPPEDKETMVKWIPAEPLIKVLEQTLVKEEDWAIPTSRDRSRQRQMAERLGLNYTALTRYLQPGAKMNAYKADEYAIRLRSTSNTYLGFVVLCSINC